MLKHGGIYLDVDAALCGPPTLFISKTHDELFICARGKPITNHFLAAKADHPVIKMISDQIKRNIDQNSTNNDFLNCSKQTIRTIEFHLKDSRGRYVNMHGMNISFSIVFNKYNIDY